MTETSLPGPLPVAEWDPSLADIVRDMNGAPLNIHGLMAHNPALLRAWWDFRNHSVTGGALGQRRAELVILRVAVHLGAWYEWASHVDRALTCGLTLAQIDRVALRQVDGWDTADALVLQSVDALMQTRAIPPGLRARLATHLDPAQILDIIAIHGMYVILGCMVGSYGLDLDPSVARRIEGKASQPEFDRAARVFRATAP